MSIFEEMLCKKCGEPVSIDDFNSGEELCEFCRAEQEAKNCQKKGK
jgi:formylmethanofuran dehydrogenase subunit E